MKTKLYLMALLALVACSREADRLQGTGYLTVRLGTDLTVTPVVKSQAGEPDPVFSLEIVPVKGGDSIHVSDYRTLESEPLTLPVGDYSVKAVSGPDTSLSWENPRYEGEANVSVLPDRICEAVVTASLARTMVTVEFDAETAAYFTEYRVTVANEGGDALVFSRGNGNLSRTGYLAASALDWDLYMVNTQGTAYRVGPVAIENVQARQHYHFSFSIDRSRAQAGSSLLRVLVDDSQTEKYYQLNLDFGVDGLPSISGYGFDLSNGISVKKGDVNNHSIVLFSAPQGMRSLTLSHSDPTLLEAGLPQFVELVDASSSTVSNLTGVGVGVQAVGYGTTATEVDLGSFLGGLPMGEYYLSLDLIDTRNRYSAATVVLSVTSPVEAEATTAKPWAGFAILNGRWFTEGRPSGLRFQWKKAGDGEWTDYAGTVTCNDAAATFSAELYGLQSATAYMFRVKTDKDEETRVVSFTTTAAGTIPNLSFDDWYQDGKVWYAASGASARVWDSANKGAATFIGSTTTPETSDVVRGKAARMESAYAVVKFAAGNIYIGSFVGLAGLGAELDWGMPFSSRPVALHGYYKYSPKAIDYTESPYGSKKGEMDACSIKMYLCDWSAPFRVNTSTSTFLQDDDPSIIAMCDFTSNVATSGYVEFTFPLQYRDDRTPKYVVIVGAASRLGDYFTGAKGSILWLDELSLVYDAGQLSEEERQLVGYRNL
ncbi:MAG: PCMD domain-containing protein [Bacteroidales bacterium]|nr:PCMD domain-containing protein [Bacteroidales bacterium]